MQPFLYRTHLMTWSTDEKDATMLLDIPSAMNININDQFTSKLVDICFNNTLQISCISLLSFAKIGRLTAQNRQNLACKILSVQL